MDAILKSRAARVTIITTVLALITIIVYSHQFPNVDDKNMQGLIIVASLFVALGIDAIWLKAQASRLATSKTGDDDSSKEQS